MHEKFFVSENNGSILLLFDVCFREDDGEDVVCPLGETLDEFSVKMEENLAGKCVDLSRL